MTKKQKELYEKARKYAISLVYNPPYVETEIYSHYVNAKVAAAIAFYKSRNLPPRAKEWILNYARNNILYDFGDYDILSFDSIKDIVYDYATEYYSSFNSRRRREIDKIDAELGVHGEVDTCDWINLCADKAFSKKYDELMER